MEHIQDATEIQGEFSSVERRSFRDYSIVNCGNVTKFWVFFLLRSRAGGVSF